MSLIKCPECNKDISDQADTCPNCGFNISEYIKEMKYAEKRKQRINEILKTIEIPKKPEKPKPINKNIHIILYSIALILFIFSIWGGFFSYRTYTFIGESTFIFPSIIAFSISFFIVIYCSRNKDEYEEKNKQYEIQLKQYNNYIENPEEYKIKIAKQQYDKEEVSRLIQNKRIEQQTIPKCPTCQSIDIRKISATSKVVNTAMFGVVGTKRYKTFHCNNCGYEW